MSAGPRSAHSPNKTDDGGRAVSPVFGVFMGERFIIRIHSLLFPSKRQIKLRIRSNTVVERICYHARVSHNARIFYRALQPTYTSVDLDSLYRVLSFRWDHQKKVRLCTPLFLFFYARSSLSNLGNSKRSQVREKKKPTFHIIVAGDTLARLATSSGFGLVPVI